MSSTPPLVKPPPDAASDPAAAPGRRTRSRQPFHCPVVLTMADGSTRQATAQDISRAGLSVLTERPVSPGSRCTLALGVSAQGVASALTVAAKSVYSSYLGPRQFRIGLVFTQLDSVTDATLRDLVG